MKNKYLMWTVVAVQAIPVPLSIITILGSFISLANIGVIAEASVFLAIVSAFSMILAGTYTITYALSIRKTLRTKTVSLVSFFPAFHLLIAIIFFLLWVNLESLYL